MCQLKHTVTECFRGCDAAALLHRRKPSLSAWYANPLSAEQAAQLQLAAQQELQRRLCSGASCFPVHVLQLVCRFQRQLAIELDYRQLLAAVRDVPERALLELVYGQLLASRKLSGAHQHLADGFVLAADCLSSTDYFQLLRQHELLDWLVLSDTACLPQSLADLLAEAAVIKQLRGVAVVRFGRTHLDTLG